MSAIKFVDDDGSTFIVKPPDTARSNHVDEAFSSNVLSIDETIIEVSDSTKHDIEDYIDEDSSVGDVEDNIEEVIRELERVEEKKEEVFSAVEEKKEEVINAVEEKKEEVINAVKEKKEEVINAVKEVEEIMKKPVGCSCLIM